MAGVAKNPILQLKRAYLTSRLAMDEALAEFSLTTAQLDILLYLWERDGLEQRALQDCLGITSGTLTGLVDSLVEAGYVERRLSDEDSRVKQLFLTAKGAAFRNDSEDVARAFFTRFFSGFTRTESALLLEWLGRIAVNMGDTSRDDCT